jgi:ATP-binding cassette subfamily B protein
LYDKKDFMLKLFRYIRLKKSLAVYTVFFLFIQIFAMMYLPALMAKIINNGVALSDMDYIYRYSGYMLLLTLTGGIAAILSTIFSALFSARISRELRSSVFKQVQAYSLSDIQQIGVPSLITRSTSDINIIQRTVMTLFQLFLPAPIMAIMGLCLAFQINATIGIITIVIIIFFSLMAIYIGGKAIPLFKIIQTKMDRITHILREIITGVRIIRAFNRESYEKRRFDTAAEDFCDVAIRTNKIFAILLPALLLIINLGIIVILIVSRSQATLGAMKIGDIFASIEYLTIVLWGATMALFVFMEIPRAQSCAARLREVLDIKPTIKDKVSAQTTITEDTLQTSTLEFKDVTFQYPNAERAVLSKISFQSKPGQTTAIIGGTGSGKSTIANLICRFYDIQGGSISINGRNITDYSQHELRNKIGFVPQKTFLFRGTIESNIKYGKPDATNQEIENAAKIAQAHSFIAELDNGYQSYVAQGGTNFSGGQKQRIAIARAIVKRPDILVFDDSFSALDYKTDSLLRKAIVEEVKDSIIIIVAQRISTIMNADQIIVLDEGQMVGIGTHNELLNNCSAYAEIARSQFKNKE